MIATSKVKAGIRRQAGDRSSRNSNGEEITELERLTLQLSQLECTRGEKRSTLESLFERLQVIRNEMSSVQQELQQIDDEIEEVEKKRNRMVEKMIPETRASFEKKRNRNGGSLKRDEDTQADEDELDSTQKYAENLTQFVTKDGQRIRRSTTAANNNDEFIGDVESDDEITKRKSNFILTMHPEEIFTEFTQIDYDYDDDDDEKKKAQEDVHDDNDDDDNDVKPQATTTAQMYRHVTSKTSSRPLSSSGGYNELDIITAGNKTRTHQHLNLGNSISTGQRAATPVGMTLTNLKQSTATVSTTLDRYFKAPDNEMTGMSRTHTVAPSNSSIFPLALQNRYAQSSTSVATTSQIPSTNRLQKNAVDGNTTYNQWSEEVTNCLRNTFGINEFRDHQKDIIHCTMSKIDAFVIMRTGGGKSLTYQLPALLEGRSESKKVTLAISPLLSLIRDQEDQMNAFAPGSAISFTPGMAGGNVEQTRRWNLLRDPNAGICIVFVTPERVSKSNKLRSELEKLHKQGRLGRFVIDECHCACQWGHDFRPDYAQLGILKRHFPDIPLIAVTATASDRVRNDCCKILAIAPNHQLFRSSANRPNLTYSIREKPDGKDAVIADMADFIQSHHPNQAGIIYTLSKKEAEEVALTLTGTYGISARAYHSEVSDSAKESIQKSWMKNRTQIVVATIAFGLGINKPDVRFVLHHSLSKTLEAYYQESGRAGRDGNPADCILYYSPKDVSRMLGMIHGQGSENSFWSMVRYGQQHGKDATCREIILAALGEVTLNDDRSKQSEDDVEVKDVSMHARIVARLLDWSAKNLTIQQLVQLWRGKEAPSFVEENPPNDLSKDDCERLIVNLMICDILKPDFVFSPYNTIVYVKIGPNAQSIISNTNTQVRMRFPVRQANTKTKKAKAVEKVASSSSSNQWISSKNSKAAVSLKTQSNTVKKGASKVASKGKATKTKSFNPIHITLADSSSSEDELRPASVAEPAAKVRRVTNEWKDGKKSKALSIDDDSVSS